MKILEYYCIEYWMKFAKPFEKKLGWCVWHSCFEYLDGCRSEYLVLSRVWS